MIIGRKNWAKNLEKKIEKGQSYIWFHCASLGEFEQGRPLIEKYKLQNKKIILTFFSPSGYEIRKNYSYADVVCYLPFDTANNARTFLDIVNPEFAVFVKYEFWYYFIAELRKRQIPIYLISGIFRKNQIFFKPWGKFYRKTLSNFSWMFIQDENSKKLLENISVNNILVCGDTRIDRVSQISKESYVNEFLEKFSANKNIIVCGSTWPPDEKIITKYVNSSNKLKAIIVPHEIHEEHLLFIEKLLKKPFVRLSNCNSCDPAEIDYVVVDSIGMLSKIYRYAKFAYIGGGFGRGIHNTLEAVVYNIPVIFGPEHKKFKEAFDLIEIGAGFSIEDYETFKTIVETKMFDNKLYIKACENANNYVAKSLGVSDLIYNRIIELQNKNEK